MDAEEKLLSACVHVFAATVCTGGNINGASPVGTCQGSGAYPAGVAIYCDGEVSLPAITGLFEVAGGTIPPTTSPSFPNFFIACTTDPDCGAGTGLYCRFDNACAVYAPASCFPLGP